MTKEERKDHIKRNQQNPPLPAKKRVDSLGNDWRRWAVKSNDGCASMICFIFPSENAAKVFDQQVKDLANKLGGIMKCKTAMFK